MDVVTTNIQSLLIDAIKAGVKDYIVKPFEPERVVQGVNKALA